MKQTSFEWDPQKDTLNQKKHRVSFEAAQEAFLDNQRLIAEDLDHSLSEPRYYCFGKVGSDILTVRFTYRENRIRIIGAGFWRKGKTFYEKENKIHK